MSARTVWRVVLALVVAAPIALLGIAAAVGALLLTTPVGARWSLGIANKLVPGTIEFATLDGSWLRGLTLFDVRYAAPGLQAAASRLEIVPVPARWLDGELAFDRLALAGASVELTEAPDAGPSTAQSVVDAKPSLPPAIERVAVRSLRVANFELVDYGVTVVELAATVEAANVSIETLSLQASGAYVELAGTVAAEDTAEGLRAQVHWQPLTVRTPVRDWSSERGDLAALLTNDTVTLESLDASLLGGSVGAHSVVALGSPTGYAMLEYDDIDPAAIDERLTGRASGAVAAAFVTQPALVMGLTGTLTGTLAGEPLDATLAARVADGVAHVERAHIDLARGSVQLDGTAAEERVDLDFRAEIPDLSAWYPALAGSLVASGSVAGPPAEARIDADVRGEQVVLEGLPPVNTLSLGVTGTVEQHTAQASIIAPLGTLDLSVQEGFRDGRLSGVVRSSTIALERGGEWSLRAPADYGYETASGEASLERLCYAGPDGAEACARYADDEASLEGSDVPVALAAAAAGVDAPVTGTADVSVELGFEPELHGSLKLSIPTLAARLETEEEGALEELASVENLELTGTLTSQELMVALGARLGVTGDAIEGHARLAPPEADGALDAAVTARLSSLAFLDAFVDPVESLDGTANVNVRATGKLATPSLEGDIMLDAVSAAVPELGIELEGGLSAHAVGTNAVTLDGRLCSGGCVVLDAQVDLGSALDGLRARGRLRGDSFELADRSDLQAVVAPDVTLEANAERVRVAGELVVTDGLVALQDFPVGAVRPAPETVVHGRTVAEEETPLPVPLVLDLTVRLDGIGYSGFGIEGDLGGNLDVDRTLDGDLLVNGSAQITDGTFTAYGQELAIERGQLAFTGAADNPALDVRATREVEGATVGLTIMGSLRDPQSEVFSMPVLSETEALARLVTGRSLENAAPADGDAIERAALGLGIRRALPALGRIGGRIGLDELGVQSTGGTSGAIVAGRQLGDDLYLRYKHGLFDDFAGLELIYRLTERFRLRTETGSAQSLDLIYERNPRGSTPLEETETPFDSAPAPSPASPSAASEASP